MTEWIVLENGRAINLAQVQDIKFHGDGGGPHATVRLASFDPTTGDKYDTTWFTVVGPDLARLRVCVARQLAPEFAECVGRLDGKRAPDHSVVGRLASLASV